MCGRTCVRPRDDLMCELLAVFWGEWSLLRNVLISGKTRVGLRDDLAKAPACIFGIVMFWKSVRWVERQPGHKLNTCLLVRMFDGPTDSIWGFKEPCGW